MHFLEAFNFSTLLHFQGHFDLSLHVPYSTPQRDRCPGNIVSSISLGIPFVSVIRCLSVHKDKREEAMTDSHMAREYDRENTPGDRRW